MNKIDLNLRDYWKYKESKIKLQYKFLGPNSRPISQLKITPRDTQLRKEVNVLQEIPKQKQLKQRDWILQQLKQLEKNKHKSLPQKQNLDEQGLHKIKVSDEQLMQKNSLDINIERQSPAHLTERKVATAQASLNNSLSNETYRRLRFYKRKSIEDQFQDQIQARTLKQSNVETLISRPENKEVQKKWFSIPQRQIKIGSIMQKSQRESEKNSAKQVNLLNRAETSRQLSTQKSIQRNSARFTHLQHSPTKQLESQTPNDSIDSIVYNDFNLKKRWLRYRSLATFEKDYAKPCLYLKHKNLQDQYDRDQHREQIVVASVNKVDQQFEDMIKNAQNMKLQRFSAARFQELVNTVVKEQRSYYYTQLRKDENLENPHIVEQFFFAVKDRDLKLTQKLLTEEPRLALSADPRQMTAVHWCAHRNFTELIQLLTMCGAEVNARDYLGRTPIYLAASKDNEESVKLLLSLKADPFIKDSQKRSAEDVAKDDKLKAIIRKGKMFQLTDAWSSKQKRQVIFEGDGIDYFKGDKYQFELQREPDTSPLLRNIKEKKKGNHKYRASGSQILRQIAKKEEEKGS